MPDTQTNPRPAHLAIYKRDEVTVIAMHGDFHEADQNLRESFYEALHAVPPRLAVDMTNCRFISYMMVGYFVEQLRQAQGRDGWIRFAGVGPYCQRLFRLTGANHVLEGFGTVDDAITENGKVPLPSEVGS